MHQGSAALLVVLTGCGLFDDAELRFEPASLELTVELDRPVPVPLRVFAGDTEVTAEVRLALDGAPLGSVDVTGFTSDGRTGGRATIAATLDGATAILPVRVVLRSTRSIDAPPGAAAWFDAAQDVVVDASLEPGDGAVLPPNLGRLDVHFAAGSNDLHEVAVIGPELELRVLGRGDAPERRVDLTSAEWDAIARTARGGAADLVVRTLSSADPAAARLAAARLAISELPFAGEVLFTGRPGSEPPQVWSYQAARASTDRWANGPNGNCLSCHLAVSRDGRRLAAGGSIDTPAGPVGGGLLVDVQTRYYAAAPSAAVGSWIAAAFDPGGALVTSSNGVLTVRDGETALPRTTLTPALPAGQPAISRDGRALAYVGGPIDPATTNPITQELRIHDWDAAAATLGAPRILVPKRDGQFLKLPDFSPDDRWVMFSRVPAQFRSSGAIVAIRADGSGGPVPLTAGLDDFARFASPIAAAHSGVPTAEPMTWIVMKSYRPVGARSQAATGQLWAMAFFPERGVASRPFHLPGQRPDVAVLHAPVPMPSP